MTDIPIIFSAPMVRALLDGRKTMTRRLAWRDLPTRDGAYAGEIKTRHPSPWQKVRPGDRLWVRESLYRGQTTTAWCYTADNKLIALEWADHRVAQMVAWAHHKEGGSCPSIHMPRWSSRLTLTVTAARIERLQAISEEDARAEGVARFRSGDTVMYGIAVPQGHELAGLSARETFTSLWCDLHGPSAWVANPEVVALTFSVEKINIDAKEAA
jgi:hypothetical protein